MTNPGYRLLLKRQYGNSTPRGYPDAPWANAVLRTQEAVQASIEQIRTLGLPLNSFPAKNWDSLAALDLILRMTNKRARIFDAGGEIYSSILPWLFMYGYRNLSAGNLVFKRRLRRGSIIYEHADITNTAYPDSFFDAITCLSVIEHGVDLRAYFREMSRLLKPGGVLVTSTDYYESQIDTRGQVAYGVPVHIFSKEEIVQALHLAQHCSLVPLSPLDLTSEAKVVYWAKYDLSYSFVIFSLVKGV